MRGFRPFLSLAACLLLASMGSQGQEAFPFRDASLETEARIDNILSLMTLDEKVGYVVTSEVERLGIPSPGRSEGIHQTVVRSFGGGGSVPTTSPLPGSAWDPPWDPTDPQAGQGGLRGTLHFPVGAYDHDHLVLWGPTSDLCRTPGGAGTTRALQRGCRDPGDGLHPGMQGDDDRYWAGSRPAQARVCQQQRKPPGAAVRIDERLMREYYGKPSGWDSREWARSHVAAYNA
ncbi:MAG: hypothetical protein R2751_10420 [Bacteroidales bacterium]